jgi:hypothetical protein
VNRLSRVDPASAAVQAARALGISFGDCASMSSPFTVPAQSANGHADDALAAEPALA